MKDEIQEEVKMFNPNNMTMLVELANLVEDKLMIQQKNTKPLAWKPSSFQNGAKLPPSLPFKRITLLEMEDYKKKGLYYNYDEKFAPGHHCATQKLYLLDVDSLVEHPDEDFKDAMVGILEEEEQPIKIAPKISYNTLYGFTSPETMKLWGYFKGWALIIFLDLGNTHNFMDP